MRGSSTSLHTCCCAHTDDCGGCRNQFPAMFKPNTFFPRHYHPTSLFCVRTVEPRHQRPPSGPPAGALGIERCVCLRGCPFCLKLQFGSYGLSLRCLLVFRSLGTVVTRAPCNKVETLRQIVFSHQMPPSWKHRVAVAVAVALLAISTTHAAEFAPPPAQYFQQFYRNMHTGTMQVGYSLDPTDVMCASIAVHNDGMVSSGWDAVYVSVPEVLADSANATLVNAGYYCAGYAEGFATGLRVMQNHWNLEMEVEWQTASPATREWLQNHTDFMNAQVAANPNDVYWQQVGNLLTQIRGLHEGYVAWANGQLPSANATMLSFMDIFLVNFVFEYYDVTTAMNALFPTESHLTPRQIAQRRLYGSHCSALIKATPSGDLIMSHNTWSTFESMLRQYKTYVFGSSYSVSFSSYPGTIHSGDDFYVLGNDFTVQETTNENYNPLATAPYVDSLSVSEFLRVLVSNRLATNGSHWGELFCQHNSGTYNNQWMVVDMAKFMLSMNRVTNDTLWIIEQMPNMCIKGDQSEILATTGYWASYNRPFYHDTFVRGGFAAHEAQYGTLFSYADNYRAEIFRRNESSVVGIESMKAMMRYNDYLHDPFSLVPNCTDCVPPYSPYLSIACRADLTLPTAQYGVLDQFMGLFDEAAIDAKIVSASMMRAPTTAPWIISSPTYGGGSNIPPFRFSTSPYNASRHEGIPDLMDFDWMQSSSVFQGATAPPPNAQQSGGVAMLSTRYHTTNYSVANFAGSLYTLIATVYANRHAAAIAPSEATVQAMVVVGMSSRYAEDTFQVPFNFIAAPPLPVGPNNDSNVRSGAASVVVSFTPADATNAVLWASDAELALAGFSAVTFQTAGQAPDEGLPHKWTWILGFSIGGIALLVVIAIPVVRRCRKNTSYADVVEGRNPADSMRGSDLGSPAVAMNKYEGTDVA